MTDLYFRNENFFLAIYICTDTHRERYELIQVSFFIFFFYYYNLFFAGGGEVPDLSDVFLDSGMP